METDELNQTEEPGAEQGETTHAEKAPEWTPWRDLRRNLRCGVRIALLRRVAIDDLRAAPGDLALLAVADFLLNLLLSFSLVGLGGEFAFRTLPSFFFHLPLLLFAGLLAGRLCARPALTAALPVALIALSIPLELCHAVLEGGAQLPRLGWLAGYLDAPYYYRFFWWWTLAAALFVGRLAPAPKPRRAAALLVFLAFVVAPLSFFPRGDLWVGSEGAEGGELHLTDEVLAAQGRLLASSWPGSSPAGRGKKTSTSSASRVMRARTSSRRSSRRWHGLLPNGSAPPAARSPLPTTRGRPPSSPLPPPQTWSGRLSG